LNRLSQSGRNSTLCSKLWRSERQCNTGMDRGRCCDRICYQNWGWNKPL